MVTARCLATVMESYNYYDIQTLVLSGAAAGFCSNFDTPISGIIASLEISSRLISNPANNLDKFNSG